MKIPKATYEIMPVPENQETDWDVIVNGKKIKATRVTLVNSLLNMSVDYGMRPEGHDGIIHP